MSHPATRNALVTGALVAAAAALMSCGTAEAPKDVRPPGSAPIAAPVETTTPATAAPVAVTPPPETDATLAAPPAPAGTSVSTTPAEGLLVQPAPVAPVITDQFVQAAMSQADNFTAAAEVAATKTAGSAAQVDSCAVSASIPATVATRTDATADVALPFGCTIRDPDGTLRSMTTQVEVHVEKTASGTFTVTAK